MLQNSINMKAIETVQSRIQEHFFFFVQLQYYALITEFFALFQTFQTLPHFIDGVFLFYNIVMVYDATKPCCNEAPKCNAIIMNQRRSDFEHCNSKYTLLLFCFVRTRKF